jgi:glycosyltransferase involved in cell wall biosynthesis
MNTPTPRTVKAPRVAIDVSAGLHEGAGNARYVRELCHALLALPQPPALLPYATSGPIEIETPPWLLALRRKDLPWRDRAWRALSLSSQVTGISLRGMLPEADLVHAANSIVPHVGGMASVVTVQDITFMSHPEVHSKLSRFHLRQMVPRACRRAKLVIVPSRATAEELARRSGVDRFKIRVVPDGYDDARFSPREGPDDGAALERYGIRPPFLLFLGTLEPRKNLLRLLDAFALLRGQGIPHRLVLAGGLGWGYQPVLDRLASMGDGQVLRVGRVLDRDLAALYRKAALMVYPSLFEGFGLPVLEAMACGTPVVTSNTSSLPEVAGDAALTVAPDDVRALAEAMRRAVTDEGVARRLRAAGPVQAARFTWRETARATLAVYQEAIALGTG